MAVRKIGLFFLGVAMLLGGCKTGLRNLGPLPVNCKNEMTMKEIVRSALIHRNWVVTAETIGRTDATLDIRDHEARISVMYTASEFSIQYVDSKNLEYEKDTHGQEMIHRFYNEWIEDLADDIRELARDRE